MTKVISALLMLLCGVVSINAQTKKPADVSAGTTAATGSAACPVCAPITPGKITGKNGNKGDEYNVVIDARFAFTKSNRLTTTYKSKKSKVHVYITNLNPYLYDYSIRVNETVVAETAHLIFLNKFSPLFAEFAPKSESFEKFSIEEADLSEGITEKKGDCHPNAHNVIKRWVGISEKLTSEGKKLEDTVHTISGKFKIVADEYHKTRSLLYDRMADCEQLCASGDQFIKTYTANLFEASHELDLIGDRIARLKKMANELRKEIDLFRAKYPRCQIAAGDYTDLLEGMSKLAETSAEDAGLLMGRFERLRVELCKHVDKFQAMNDAIEQVNRHRDILFVHREDIGDYDSLTEAEVVIERKPGSLVPPTDTGKCETIMGKPESQEDREVPEQAQAEPPADEQEVSAEQEPAPKKSNGVRKEKAGVGKKQTEPTTQQKRAKSGENSSQDVNTVAVGYFKPNGSQKQGKEGEPKEPNGGGKQTNPSPPPQEPKPAAEKPDQGEQKNDSRQSTRFSFGVPRFSISGGIAFSTLKKREFQVVSGFERDRQGNLVDGTTLTRIITEKESSNFGAGPLFLLNIRLLESTNLLHFSAGITGKKDNAGVDIEYLLGPSFNLLDEKIFVTTGLYLGRQQKLAGDLYPGIKVPDSLTEAPIQKEFRPQFGFSLTFKIPTGR